MKACIVLASEIDDAALGATPSSALVAHVATCEACASRLERRRALAQRIDRGLETYVRVELPPGSPDRIAARTSEERPGRWRAALLGVPAGVALAAALFVFISSLASSRESPRPADIAALSDWRSPTASLLLSRSNVLDAPFTLRGVRASTSRLHS